MSCPTASALYATDNSEYAGDDTSNKTLGGGMVSSVPDLVRFAGKILDGTLLNAAQRDTLFHGVGGYVGRRQRTGRLRLVGKAGRSRARRRTCASIPTTASSSRS